MATDIVCSGNSVEHRREEMSELMGMWNEACKLLWKAEELQEIWDALHDLMKGIDACDRIPEIKEKIATRQLATPFEREMMGFSVPSF